MDAGKLDQQIVIEVQSTVKNALNEPVSVWATLFEPWARVMQEMGREFLSGEFHAEEKAVFIIRWRDGVEAKARIVWGGRYWNIVSIAGTQRTGYLQLGCKSIDGSAQ